MKTHNDSPDKELEGFFSELKLRDREIDIPPFPSTKPRSIWKYLSIGIAAVLAIGIWFSREKPQDTSLDKDLIIITLVEDENQKQRFIIESKSTIDVWESPTASLLTEY